MVAHLPMLMIFSSERHELIACPILIDLLYTGISLDLRMFIKFSSNFFSLILLQTISLVSFIIQ